MTVKLIIIMHMNTLSEIPIMSNTDFKLRKILLSNTGEISQFPYGDDFIQSPWNTHYPDVHMLMVHLNVFFSPDCFSLCVEPNMNFPKYFVFFYKLCIITVKL